MILYRGKERREKNERRYSVKAEPVTDFMTEQKERVIFSIHNQLCCLSGTACVKIFIIVSNLLSNLII
jgi:hypothetical protein